jgi:hypothetical protein
MRSFVFLAILGLASASASAARADDVTEYRFDDDLVRGDLPFPSGEVLTVRRPGDRPSLVRARPHYIPELLKSVEDL